MRFKDRAGDTLTIEEADHGVSIDNPDSDVVDWYFSTDIAVELADAIYEAAGRTPRVYASDISANEALLRIAGIHALTVTFRYAKGDGQPIETRSLVPERVQINKNGDVSFVGPDPDRSGYRTFRVDRIKGVVAVNG